MSTIDWNSIRIPFETATADEHQPAEIRAVEVVGHLDLAECDRAKHVSGRGSCTDKSFHLSVEYEFNRQISTNSLTWTGIGYNPSAATIVKCPRF